jgi:hypothetical protein
MRSDASSTDVLGEAPLQPKPAQKEMKEGAIWSTEYSLTACSAILPILSRRASFESSEYLGSERRRIPGNETLLHRLHELDRRPLSYDWSSKT